jgi:hypothetical protein
MYRSRVIFNHFQDPEKTNAFLLAHPTTKNEAAGETFDNPRSDVYAVKTLAPDVYPLGMKADSFIQSSSFHEIFSTTNSKDRRRGSEIGRYKVTKKQFKSCACPVCLAHAEALKRLQRCEREDQLVVYGGDIGMKVVDEKTTRDFQKHLDLVAAVQKCFQDKKNSLAPDEALILIDFCGLMTKDWKRNATQSDTFNSKTCQVLNMVVYTALKASAGLSNAKRKRSDNGNHEYSNHIIRNHTYRNWDIFGKAASKHDGPQAGEKHDHVFVQSAFEAILPRLVAQGFTVCFISII